MTDIRVGRPVKAYGDDLAYIHDAGHGDFALSAAPALLSMLRDGGIQSGLVVDLGCGSGIWARELARAGFGVLGVDISPSMIDIARKRVPEGEFRTESYLAADLPRCVAVTAIGECFSYLFDRSNTERKLSALFHRIFEALRPGGLLIFDVVAPGRVPRSGPHRRYREGEDWAVLVTAEEDQRHRLLTRRITSFRQVGKRYRRACEVHRLRLFDGSEMASRLRCAGFRVRRLAGYGKLRFVPGQIGFLARKPLRE